MIYCSLHMCNWLNIATKENSREIVFPSSLDHFTTLDDTNGCPIVFILNEHKLSSQLISINKRFVIKIEFWIRFAFLIFSTPRDEHVRIKKVYTKILKLYPTHAFFYRKIFLMNSAEKNFTEYPHLNSFLCELSVFARIKSCLPQLTWNLEIVSRFRILILPT